MQIVSPIKSRMMVVRDVTIKVSANAKAVTEDWFQQISLGSFPPVNIEYCRKAATAICGVGAAAAAVLLTRYLNLGESWKVTALRFLAVTCSVLSVRMWASGNAKIKEHGHDPDIGSHPEHRKACALGLLAFICWLIALMLSDNGTGWWGPLAVLRATVLWLISILLTAAASFALLPQSPTNNASTEQ